MSPDVPALDGFDRRLLDAAKGMDRPAGTILFRTGQKPAWMYYVGRGEAVMQRVTRSGAPVLLQRASGGFIAEASLASDRYHCDGMCRTSCRLLAFPLPALRRAIDEDAGTRWAWINLLSAQARLQRARIERQSLKTIRERLEHLILSEGSGKNGYVGPTAKLQLAYELGVSPEALYRCLKSLQDEGTLIVEGRRYKWTR